MDSERLVVVFSGNPMEAEMFKSLLDEHGIGASLRNLAMGTLAPWYVSPGGHSPVDVEVLESDKEAALELLALFQQEP
ncbi:MAG: DUF2007 domain-containing protein [Breznakibacter sp.]